MLGLRTLLSAVHVRAGLEAPEEVARPGRAFRTALAATASNPLTIASWAGVFAAASTGTDASPVPLVLGVGLDVLAGLGLLGFAGALGWRTATDG